MGCVRLSGWIAKASLYPDNPWGSAVLGSIPDSVVGSLHIKEMRGELFFLGWGPLHPSNHSNNGPHGRCLMSIGHFLVLSALHLSIHASLRFYSDW